VRRFSGGNVAKVGGRCNARRTEHSLQNRLAERQNNPTLDMAALLKAAGLIQRER
jgi:hypothetical protein